MSDWSRYAGGSSTTGGGGWSRYGGGGTVVSSGGGGGGGLLDAIGGELSHIPGAGIVGGLAGGVGEVTRGFTHDIGSTISAGANLPMALYHFNQYDAKKYPISLNPMQDWRELTQSYHDPHSIGGGAVAPTVKSTEHDIHNVRTGNWHAIAQHPLSPLLDVMSVASLGGGAALRGIKVADEAGMLAKGGRLARLADENARTITDAGKTETLPRGRTVQGRLAQNAIDRYSERHPTMPGVGVQSRLKRINLKNSYHRTEAEKAVANKMVRAGEPLTKDEEFATHIAAEGVPLRDRIALYDKLNAENPSAAISRYIRVMKRPGVEEALKNPRDEFVNFMHQVHGVEAKGGETLMQAGKLTPEIRAERAALPRRFAAGARYEAARSEHMPGLDPYETDRGAMRLETRRAESDLRRAQARVTRLQERVRIHGGRLARAGENATGTLKSTAARAEKDLATARSAFADAKQRRDFLAEGEQHIPPPTPARTIKTDSGFVGPGKEVADQLLGPTDISEKLPQGFRFPHVGTTGNPSLFRTPLGSLGGPKTPTMLRKSHLARFAKGQFITNPQAVYSEDFMRTARYLHELDLQHNFLDKVSRPLDVANVEHYGKASPDDAYYWPASAQQAAKAKGLTNRSIPRAAREAAMRQQDLGVLDPAAHEAGVEAASRGTVGNLHDLGLEGKTIEHLQQLGVRALPKTYANAYRREFGRANGMVRLLIDKPTSAWRSATLKYRPAWAVNNLLGQHLLYAMANPNLGAAASYAQAAIGHRANRDLFESTPGMRQGLATTQKGITHTGGAQAIVDRSAALKTARAIGMSAKAVAYPIRKFGDAIQAVNELGENIPREAQFIHTAKGQLDLVNQTLAEAVHSADPRVVQRIVDEVNSLQGDFGSMSHFERTVLRRIFPFYAWFKVITKLTGKYASQYPLRVKMLQAMSGFLNEPNAQMPSYLQGFINLVRKGQVETGLSTTGLNPFQTIPQLLDSAGGLIHGKPTFGTQNPGGLLNPGIQSAVTALSGQDNFTGNAYKGPGANQGAFGRALGQFVSSLPEYSLFEKAGGMGPQSTLYSQQHFAGLPPYLWNYLGLPIRRVKLPEAKSRKKAGQ